MNNDDQNPNNPANKKVFDVMRPGKTPASANSRHVVVGHKPQVQDDQFVPGAGSRIASSNPFDDRQNLMDPTKKVSIQPLADGSDANTAPLDFTKDVAASDEAQSAETSPMQAPTENATSKQPAQPALLPAAEDELLLPAKIDSSSGSSSASAPDTESTATDAEATTLAIDNLKQKLEPATKAPTIPEPQDIFTPDEPDSFAETDTSVPETKQTPEHLAVGSTVEAPEASNAPVPQVTSNQKADENDTDASSASEDNKPQGKLMTSDEVMAATNAPLLDHAVVSHHKRRTRWWELMLTFLLIVLLAIVVVDILLDTNVLSPGFNIPHTNFF